MTLAWLPISLAAVAVAIALHAVVCRINLPLDRVVRFVIAGLLTGALLIAMLLQRYSVFSVEFFTSLLLYAFTCELYIFLFTMTISSISSNILAQLAGREIGVEEIKAKYDSKLMVHQRLQRLQATGFVSDRQGALSLSPKGVRMVKTFDTLRSVFRHAAPRD